MILLVLACRAEEDPTLRLRWIQGHPEQTWERAKEGLWWGMSNLGATPEPGDPGLTVVEKEEAVVTFDLDLSQVGFSERAEDIALEVAQDVVSSEEMQHRGHVDLGRFMMHLVFQPWHYTAITGVCPDLETYQQTRQDPKPLTYAMTESLLVEGDRLIQLNHSPETVDDIGFAILDGDLALSDAIADEVEVIDIMPNGRQRFAIYGADGNLRPWADPALGPAGQPGRCMWCHEAGLQTGTPKNPTTKPHLSFDDWFSHMEHAKGVMVEQRQSVPTSVNFDDYHVHTSFEWLAEMFLQPSTARMALDWGVGEAEVTDWLSERGFVPSTNEEWPDVGVVWSRRALDADPTLLADLGVVDQPFAPVAVLESAREPVEEDLVGEHWLNSLGDCRP